MKPTYRFVTGSEEGDYFDIEPIDLSDMENVTETSMVMCDQYYDDFENNEVAFVNDVEYKTLARIVCGRGYNKKHKIKQVSIN